MIEIKVAIISDIHGNSVALREVLKDAEANKVDDYVFLGDLVNDLPFGNETLAMIRAKSDKVIKGNKEQYLIEYEKYNYDWPNLQFKNIKFMYNELTKENLDYVRNLPQTMTVEFEGVKVLLSHGSPKSIEEQLKHQYMDVLHEYAKDLKEDVLLFGHTHEQMWYENMDGKLLLNAGCCGVSPHYVAKAEYVIMEFKDGKVTDIDLRLVDYDLEEVKKKIIESGILDGDKVLMNLTYCAISGYAMERYYFLKEAKNIRQERKERLGLKDEKGIYSYFRLYDDDIWLGLADKYKEYFIFK